MLKKNIGLFKKKTSSSSSSSSGSSSQEPKSSVSPTSQLPPASKRISLGNDSFSNPLKNKALNVLSNKLRNPGDNLSEGLESIKFSMTEMQAYGLAGKVCSLAFDPLQSLMALATEYGHIHVFGQARVSHVFKLDTVNVIKYLKFIKGCYLIAFDSDRTIFVMSLLSKKLLNRIVVKSAVASIESDYSLEFVYVGLTNGSVIAFNIETGNSTVLYIREQQSNRFLIERDARALAIKIHPRDIGLLLIAYPKVIVTFSLSENKTINEFVYQLPRTARGGENATYEYFKDTYTPNVKHVAWHPNGLHMVSAYDDNSLVFWDAKTGEQILARTLFDSYVDEQTGVDQVPEPMKMTPIKKLAWLCDSDPEKTSLLIYGGDAFEMEGFHQLVRMNFGKTLSYSMTSYTQMAKYYAAPKEQNIFAIHSNANIVDFTPLGEKSPYFDGNHDPSLIAVVLSDGSVKFLSYPSGALSFRADRFPATVSWLNPKITCSTSSFMNKNILYSMLDVGRKHNSMLKGGIPSRPKFKADAASVIITGHESGYIRVWNASEGDLDSSSVFEIDISSILFSDEYSVSKISFANESLDIAASLGNGYVLLFLFKTNPHYEADVEDLNRRITSLEISDISKSKSVINDISNRSPKHVRKGFLPVYLIKQQDQERVTALCNTNLNFMAIGYHTGRVTVIDKRGRGTIISEMMLKDLGLSIPVIPTCIEFGYGFTSNPLKPSLMMYIGSSIGRLYTYEAVADHQGKYSMKYVNELDTNDDEIFSIIPVNTKTGRPCIPTKSQPSSEENAPIIVVSSSSSDVRCSQIGKKMQHHTFSKGDLSSVGITGCRTDAGLVSFCIVCILGVSKKLVSLSLPSLREMASLRIPYRLDSEFTKQSSVLPLGDVFLRINETEAVLVNFMNMRRPIMSLETSQDEDVLCLKNILVPPRPLANTLVKGTSNMTYYNLYRLLQGKDRPTAEAFPEYQVAWTISPYNPINYSLLGTSKPIYYDPNALHQHPNLHDIPKPAVNYNYVKKSFTKWSQGAQHSLDNAVHRVDDYANNLNDDFDNYVSQTKNDLIKGAISGQLGI